MCKVRNERSGPAVWNFILIFVSGTKYWCRSSPSFWLLTQKVTKWALFAYSRAKRCTNSQNSVLSHCLHLYTYLLILKHLKKLPRCHLWHSVNKSKTRSKAHTFRGNQRTKILRQYFFATSYVRSVKTRCKRRRASLIVLVGSRHLSQSTPYSERPVKYIKWNTKC